MPGEKSAGRGKNALVGSGQNSRPGCHCPPVPAVNADEFSPVPMSRAARWTSALTARCSSAHGVLRAGSALRPKSLG